jgi:TolB-like protein/Flp pilus assembly protein TadD
VNRPLRADEEHPQDNLNKTYYRDQINKVANAVKDIITALKKADQSERKIIEPAREIRTGVKNQKIKLVVAIGLALAILLPGFLVVRKLVMPSGVPVERSIAVLPFRNLSNDTAQIYFCDGFMEELLSSLQKVKSFEVRSRTSSEQYRETNKSIPAIGNELNVNYLVEGSVGREGNNLKIWVQLIDAKADKHLWSDEYQREMTIEQIFSLQSEIAGAIAAELKAVLTPEEIQKIEKRPTENLEAYNLYLQGNYYLNKSYDSQDYNKSIQLYEKVIELDPGFALAYTRLAMSNLAQYWFYHNRGSEILQKCRVAIDKAFEIDPELLEAHLAMGVYYYHGFNDYPKALKHLELVLEEQPGNIEALYYEGCVYRRAGNWEISKSFFVKASELDPKSASISFNTGETFDLMRNYQEALRYYELTLSNNPDWTYFYKDLAELYLRIDGNTVRARDFMLDETRRDKVLNKDSLSLEVLVLIDTYDGNYEEALKILSQSGVNIFEAQWYYRPRDLYYARIYGLMRKPELARAYYDSTRLLIEKRIIGFPEDQRLYSTLGIAYAGLGWEAKAISSGAKAVKMLPVEKEAYKGVYLVEDLAYIYVLLGKYPEAIAKLDYLLSIPGPLSVNILSLDPRWAPLRNMPEFKRLIEKYSNN